MFKLFAKFTASLAMLGVVVVLVVGLVAIARDTLRDYSQYRALNRTSCQAFLTGINGPDFSTAADMVRLYASAEATLVTIVDRPLSLAAAPLKSVVQLCHEKPALSLRDAMVMVGDIALYERLQEKLQSVEVSRPLWSSSSADVPQSSVSPSEVPATAPQAPHYASPTVAQ